MHSISVHTQSARQIIYGRVYASASFAFPMCTFYGVPIYSGTSQPVSSPSVLFSLLLPSFSPFSLSSSSSSSSSSSPCCFSFSSSLVLLFCRVSVSVSARLWAHVTQFQRYMVASGISSAGLTCAIIYRVAILTFISVRLQQRNLPLPLVPHVRGVESRMGKIGDIERKWKHLTLLSSLFQTRG